MDTALGKLPGAFDVVPVVGVPAVDDDVARLQEGAELGDHLTHVGRRDHDPGSARRLQLPDEVLQRGRPRGPFLLEVAGDVRGPVPDDAPVPGADDPLREVGSHAAESDHAELHLDLLARWLPKCAEVLPWEWP